jgi:hypothetical protein
MKRILGAAIFVGILMASPASGYRFTGNRWPSAATTMYVSVGNPWDTAFNAAMALWNQNTGFKFTGVSEYSDPCSNPNANGARNGLKLSDTVCGDAFNANVLAVTLPWAASGVTVQAGVIFNTKFNWGVYDGPHATGEYNGVVDFRRVAVHELGHVIGLGHEDVVPAIMTTSVTAGSTIVAPQADDAAAISSLYGVVTPPIVVPPPVTASPTAGPYHVFPQFADGAFGDGSYYRTTLMISNPSATATANCTFKLYGLTVDNAATFTYSVDPTDWVITSTRAAQSFKSGYATLRCSANVEAQLLYAFYGASGVKIAEATVFSSPAGAATQILADSREGARVGVAIANDTDEAANYTLFAYDNNGKQVGSATIAMNARSNRAAFADELMRLPAGHFGRIIVSSTNGTASIIGLRFTGGAFTTIPETVLSTAAPTAGTSHVFPQFADGRLGDGSYYRTTLMIANPTTASANCTFRLHGLTVDGQSTFTYNFGPSGWLISPTSGTESFRAGYATLQCSTNVEAQLLYTLYTPDGIKVSEATVFSSAPAATTQILADNREGSRTGLAIANDSNQSVTYTVTAFDADSRVVGVTNITLGAHSNRAAFVDELLPVGPNYLGQVVVTGSGGSASLIGLRFTGGAFTTIPQTTR